MSKSGETRIFVGQLPKKIRSNYLDEQFSKFGKIRDIDLKTNHAFIEFDNPRDAEEAVEEMDGKTIMDSKISVQLKGNHSND